jgi:hypothetical protein
MLVRVSLTGPGSVFGVLGAVCRPCSVVPLYPTGDYTRSRLSLPHSCGVGVLMRRRVSQFPEHLRSSPRHTLPYPGTWSKGVSPPRRYCPSIRVCHHPASKAQKAEFPSLARQISLVREVLPSSPAPLRSSLLAGWSWRVASLPRAKPGIVMYRGGQPYITSGRPPARLHVP